LAARVLSSEARGRIVRFLESRLCPDGGFRGAPGGADLYYTFFGTMAFRALTGSAPPASARYAGGFHGKTEGLDLAHLRALAGLLALAEPVDAVALSREILNAIAGFASSDGGYHHSEREAANSTPYGVFLATSAIADSGRSASAEQATLLDAGVWNDVGFELATNASAALAVCADAGRGDSRVAEAAAAFLKTLERNDGGFAAAPMVPFSDLLSTASAVSALALCERFEIGKRAEGVRSFVESAWDDDSGGFAAVEIPTTPTVATDTPAPDCEHTFHALLVLGAMCPRG
jgi:prenyltransferase beta subunit